MKVPSVQKGMKELKNDTSQTARLHRLAATPVRCAGYPWVATVTQGEASFEGVGYPVYPWVATVTQGWTAGIDGVST